MDSVSEPHGTSRGSDGNGAAAGTEAITAAGIPVLVKSSTVDEPRLMWEDDLPWLDYLCRKRYSSIYDPDSTAKWYRNKVMNDFLMFYPIRTQDAFCISMLSVCPWTPAQIECNVIFICADDDCMWQALRLLRCSIDWAKRRQCSLWRMSSDTDYDLRMLARRLGATELSPRFVLRLGD